MRLAYRNAVIALAVLLTAACSEPGSQPPTDDELLGALKYALSGADSASTEINNPISGVKIEIRSFENLGCEKAEGVPGYVCDYIVDASVSMHSNDGSSAGAQQANAMNLLMQGLMNMQPAGPRPARARFAYVKSRDRWMKMDD